MNAALKPLEIIPSKHQEAIYSFVTNGHGNAIVEAVAGSGKTTTLVEAIRRIVGRSNIFLAFNKSIAEELKKRGVNARTFHSLCFSQVLRAKGVKDINQNKVRDLIDARFGDKDARMYGPFISRLVSLAKNSGIGCLLEDTEQNWSDIASHHDLELDDEGADYASALRFSSEILQLSNQFKGLDFDDLLYFAVKDGISLPKFDFVFVDEAQDTNAIQRAILRKIMHQGSRLIAVGDPAQAIYGFRGSDSDSMDLIATEFSAIRLPLTVSYRCPTSVVEHARQWVSHIQAAPNAPAGSVNDLDQAWNPKTFQSDDLVVCRTTKPLVSLAYQLLTARVPVRILGKDIGAGLKSLIKKMKPKGIQGLVEKLEAFTLREVEKAKAKKLDAKAEAIQDKTDCVMFLIHTLDENNRTVPALYDVIDKLFADGVNTVVLATIHKSKGLEADRVFWLNSQACPARWARQPWQQQQERNLAYVATTRAKSELYLIEESKGDASREAA
jgi:DNA helicase II / ATP-dependent DNA helicase PcrA